MKHCVSCLIYYIKDSRLLVQHGRSLLSYFVAIIIIIVITIIIIIIIIIIIFIIIIIIIYWKHSYHKSVPENLQCLEILQCWPNSSKHWMK